MTTYRYYAKEDSSIYYDGWFDVGEHTSGKILKNADNIQGLIGAFSSNASGIATAIGGTSETAVGPADADFTAYIGSNEVD